MSRSHTSPSPDQRRSARKPWRWIGLLTAVLVLVLLPLTAVGVGVHLENNQSFCAGCHTQPETTYVQRAQSQHPTDLASYHATTSQPTACIQCHSGKGTKGRANAMLLGAHDALAFVRGTAVQPAKLTRAIADENCLKCHADIAQSRTFQNHFHALLPQWQSVDPGAAASCVDCHSAHTTDGQQEIAFLNKQRTVAQCNNCHRLLGDD